MCLQTHNTHIHNVMQKAISITLCTLPARFDSVVEGDMNLSALCLGCADMEVTAEHPLFHGSLCKACKVGTGALIFVSALFLG